MKKYILLIILVSLTLLFTVCSPSKKAAAKVNKSTYESDIATLIMINCTPCHIPSKGGFKKAFDNYESAKTNIDEMIKRIELNPTDKGFMPFKKTVKLSDSTINAFKKWRDDGLLEK